MRNTPFFSVFTTLLFAALGSSFVACLGVRDALAQPASLSSGFSYLLEGYTGEYLDQDQGPGATRKTGENEAPSRYIYETPSVKALSHLFWAVGFYNIGDNEAIDEFMRINECSIYTSYHSDEIEWDNVRNATRDFLRDNKAEFPTRFEFVLPLKLGDYDEKRQAFEVQEEYAIKSARRFELMASDFRSPPCSKDHNIAKGYPRAIVLEFSRPFNITHVPSEHSKALEYIRRKLNIMKNRLDERQHTKAKMYAMRDAYLFIKVKIFTHGKHLGLNLRKVPSVQMMGVMEGYEIYEDRGKENLFFAQNYVSSQSKGKLNDRLKAQYQMLRRKHEKGEGILR